MRKLCLFAAPSCSAIFIACYALPLPAVFPAALIAAALGILCAFLKRFSACLVCLGLSVGLLWFRGYTDFVRAPAEALAGQTTSFTATVVNWPQETSVGGVGVEVRLHLPDAPDPKVLLYTEAGLADLVPGDTLSGTARFETADVVRGEEVTYYEARGIYLRGSTTATPAAHHPEKAPVSVWPVYISHALKQSAVAIFPDDVSGLMIALITGDRDLLSDGDYAALRRSGAAHIVAVSGLHLSFFAGLLALFFRRRSRLGAGLTVLLCFLFAAVAGFTPSILRAAFMVSTTLLAPLVGREEDRPTTLTATLFILLLCNPYCAQSVSLQLSFASVAGIYLVSSPLYRVMTRTMRSGTSLPRRLLRRGWLILAGSFSVTLGALMLTTPLTALYFGSVSLISPLTNLLTLWAVSCVFPLGLVLTLLGIALPGLAALLALPVTLLARYIMALTRALGFLPFASLSMDSVYVRGWLILVYAILLLVWIRRCRRPILPVGIGVIALCAALLLTRFSLFAPALSITMLDVGQGQCILLCSGGRTALIDCGGTGENAGDVAADYLQSLGVSRLDLLVLTHCHDDHANGVPQLLERLEVDALVLPKLAQDESPYRSEILSLAREKGTQISLLSQNRTLSLGHAALTLYAPLGDGGSNEEGLFVLASCGDFDLLVTGDANSFVESLLVKYGQLPDVEVLVAGHHGSRHSTSELLLDAITPETCLISVGYNNYGHPTDETLSRLTQRDITVCRTDQMGHLTIRYKGD